MHDDKLYDRQERLKVEHIPERVAIIGCGGTGMNVGWLLAMVGVRNLYLFDMDKLEESNRARLPYTREDVGQPKNRLLKEFIYRIRPDTEITLFGEANDVSLPMLAQYNPEYLFDCSDRRRTQRSLVEWCKKTGVQYVRVGYNGEHFTVDNTVTAFQTDLPDENGYTIVPSYAPTTLLPALLAVDGICRLGRVPRLCTTATELINAGEKL
jgi:molybdopterin/thiamine biosynthesis adenylyltransferase